MGRMQEKVVLVTGASQGMGRAHAQLLAKEGAAVIVTDVNEAQGLETAQLILDTGGIAVFHQHDVASAADWARVVEASIDQFGRVDVLVNNAGVLTLAMLEKTDETIWDWHMNVNAKSVFLGCKHILPAMKLSKAGSIVNISSLYALVGAPDAIAYSASKGAVRAFSRAAATELHTYGIRVNAVFPGVISTPMTAPVLTGDPAIAKEILGTTILERAAKPEEVSSAVLFLASDESSFMTGSEIVVDGGFSAV